MALGVYDSGLACRAMSCAWLLSAVATGALLEPVWVCELKVVLVGLGVGLIYARLAIVVVGVILNVPHYF